MSVIGCTTRRLHAECAACRTPWTNLLDQSIEPRHRQRLAGQIAPGRQGFRPDIACATTHIRRRTGVRAAWPCIAHAATRRRLGRVAFPTSIPVTFALRDMSQELEGVASCFILAVARVRAAAPVAQTRGGSQTTCRGRAGTAAAADATGCSTSSRSASTAATVTLTGYSLRRRPQVARGQRREARAWRRQCREQDRAAAGVARSTIGSGGRRSTRSTATISCRGIRLAARCRRGTSCIQSRRFPGLQPFGTYPIHIVVRNSLRD